jgi:putative methyltransferase (TIGR04325 family)
MSDASIRALAKRILPRSVVEYLRPAPRPTVFLAGERGMPSLPRGVWESDEWIAYCGEKLARASLSSDQLDYLDCFCATVAGTAAEVSVADWGGGTGFVYHVVRSRLSRALRLKWTVVDNERGMSMGRSAATPELTFANKPPGAHILLINTSLQYVDLSTLAELLRTNSYDVIAMTRLLVSNMTQVVAEQVWFGRYLEVCRFHVREEIFSILKSGGFELALEMPNHDEIKAMNGVMSSALKEKLATSNFSVDLYFRRNTAQAS